MEKFHKYKQRALKFLVALPWRGEQKLRTTEICHAKTKEMLAFDEGLVEKQTPFLAVARPIATGLEKLDESVDDKGNESCFRST